MNSLCIGEDIFGNLQTIDEDIQKSENGVPLTATFMGDTDNILSELILHPDQLISYPKVQVRFRIG
jgi:hypothetical protein